MSGVGNDAGHVDAGRQVDAGHVDAGHGGHDAGHGVAPEGHGVTPDAEGERGGVKECDVRLEDLGEVVRRVLRLRRVPE